MKFGVREITDIVFRTKYKNQQVGSQLYPQDYPVLLIDSAKMSSLENAVSTVYAQGGRGNPRLLAWDGDRTATFKFEDSLITDDGLAILTGSNVVKPNEGQKYRQQFNTKATATESKFWAAASLGLPTGTSLATGVTPTLIILDASGDIKGVTIAGATISSQGITVSVTKDDPYIIDFYVNGTGAQLQVEAGKFAGYYYIEANTLFRDSNGTDHPAQITIPKGKIKSNFTLTMSPTGDPTTFSFEVDALPDTTYAVSDKKVLYTLDIADIAVISDNIT